jgi:hypothetical protein
MRKQEPHAFRQGRLLGKQASNQPNEGACTIVHRQDRRCVLATEWVLGDIFDCTCEKSAVHVKQGCGT